MIYSSSSISGNGGAGGVRVKVRYGYIVFNKALNVGFADIIMFE